MTDYILAVGLDDEEVIFNVDDLRWFPIGPDCPMGRYYSDAAFLTADGRWFVALHLSQRWHRMPDARPFYRERTPKLLAAALVLAGRELPPELAAIVDAAAGPACPVMLGGPDEPPKVRGREVKPLTRERWKVVKALVEVWPGTLTKNKLITSSSGGAVKMLVTVSKLPGWETAFRIPGKPGRGNGYGIALE